MRVKSERAGEIDSRVRGCLSSRTAPAMVINYNLQKIRPAMRTVTHRREDRGESRLNINNLWIFSIKIHARFM